MLRLTLIVSAKDEAANVHATIQKGSMGYDCSQLTTVAVEPIFFAFQ